MSLERVKELVLWAQSHGAYLHEQVEVYDDLDFGIALRVKSSSLARHEPAYSIVPEPRPMSFQNITLVFECSRCLSRAAGTFVSIPTITV